MDSAQGFFDGQDFGDKNLIISFDKAPEKVFGKMVLGRAHGRVDFDPAVRQEFHFLKEGPQAGFDLFEAVAEDGVGQGTDLLGDIFVNAGAFFVQGIQDFCLVRGLRLGGLGRPAFRAFFGNGQDVHAGESEEDFLAVIFPQFAELKKTLKVRRAP